MKAELLCLNTRQENNYIEAKEIFDSLRKDESSDNNLRALAEFEYCIADVCAWTLSQQLQALKPIAPLE